MSMMYRTTRRLLLVAARPIICVSLSLAFAISLYGQQQFKTSLKAAQELLEGGKDDDAKTALDSLIHGVVDGGFELTGPIARGDWSTVERHLAAIRAARPELEELYVVLAEATARIAGRDPAEVPA